MEFLRFTTLSRGSSTTVSLASPREDHSRLMVVKSAPSVQSSSLRREKSILADLQDCPHIVRCFGDAHTDHINGKIYNIFLEYAPGGSLSDLLFRFGGQLTEPDLKFYTRSILIGLRCIHERGYVHCDIKPQNVLITEDKGVVIADFGLASKLGESREFCFRGTPLYAAPESVARGEYEAPVDIWSLGCVVAEMASGKPAWGSSTDGWGLLMKIGFGNEVPDIPGELSEDGKDFLSRCLVREPDRRWTAEMLLDHPFLTFEVEEIRLCPQQSILDCSRLGISPRSVFERTSIQSLVSPSTCSTSAESIPDFDSGAWVDDRIAQLGAGQRPEWPAEEGWFTVRSSEGILDCRGIDG